MATIGFDQRTVFTELTDAPNSYSGQGGKSVKVKESEDGIEFAAGGGGGATAFTELTDVPATILPYSTLVPKGDGTGLEFSTNYQVLSFFGDGVTNGIVSYLQKSFTNTNYDDPSCSIAHTTQVDSEYARATLNIRASGVETVASLLIKVSANDDTSEYIAEINKGADADFKMTGFDVVASDASAHMTVNAVEYSIAKAIKVKIGSSTYFWPLFGPVVP
jgi:hypothetical protein